MLPRVLSRARTGRASTPRYYTYLWEGRKGVDRADRDGAASAKPIKVQMYGDADGIASSTVTGKSS